MYWFAYIISLSLSLPGMLETTDQLAIAAAIGLPAPLRQPSVSEEVGPQGDNRFSGR